MIVKAEERIKEDQTWVDCEVKQKTRHRGEEWRARGSKREEMSAEMGQ